MTNRLILVIFLLLAAIAVVGSALAKQMGISIADFSLPSPATGASGGLLPSNVWLGLPPSPPDQRALVLSLAVSPEPNVAAEILSARVVSGFAPNVFTPEGAWHLELTLADATTVTIGINDPTRVELQTGAANPPGRIEQVPATLQLVVPLSAAALSAPITSLSIRNASDVSIFGGTLPAILSGDMAAINASATITATQACIPKACPQLAGYGVPSGDVIARLQNPAGLVCPGRTWLSVANVAVPYSPMNSLVFKPGCP